MRHGQRGGLPPASRVLRLLGFTRRAARYLKMSLAQMASAWEVGPTGPRPLPTTERRLEEAGEAWLETQECLTRLEKQALRLLASLREAQPRRRPKWPRRDGPGW
jgi:hypothetical protein